MPEFSDLPVEIQRIIAEKCEFRPRFNLRSTSKTMKEVVDQSKLVLHTVRLDIRNPGSLRMSFQFAGQNGNITHHEIEMDIENPDSMETTAKWMATILKNSLIEYFHFSVNHKEVSEDLIKDFIKRVKDNLTGPLKIRTIYWRTKGDPFLICDKLYTQRLICYHDDPNFFRQYQTILMNLDQVALDQTMDITDEDVLSMKATRINLKSEKFTAEMVNQLVNQFLAKALVDSDFCIINPNGNFALKIRVPEGFSNPATVEGSHDKINEGKRISLKVQKDLVTFYTAQYKYTAWMVDVPRDDPIVLDDISDSSDSSSSSDSDSDLDLGPDEDVEDENVI